MSISKDIINGERQLREEARIRKNGNSQQKTE